MKIVVFTTLSSEDPAHSSAYLSASSTARVCVATSPLTRSPVFGSIGGGPEQNRKSPALTRIDSGAPVFATASVKPGTRMISFFIELFLQQYVCFIVPRGSHGLPL